MNDASLIPNLVSEDEATVVASGGNNAHLPSISPFLNPRPSDDFVKDAKIIVVDDDPTVIQITGKILRDAGFTRDVVGITDPSEAIAKIPDLLPDLVLLDLRMKPMDGLEILEYIRQTLHTQYLPVIVLTGEKDETVKIRALNMGANDLLTKPVLASELCARVRNMLSEKAYRSQAADFAVRMESDLLSDSLTGIANRKAFDFVLRRKIAEWQLRKGLFGVLMVELDNLKSLISRYGQKAGDIVLQTISQLCSRETRVTDLVARFGSDQFAIILMPSSLEESKNAAERLHRLIEDQPMQLEEHQIHLSACIGVSNVISGDDEAAIVDRALKALHAAKENGRNCCFSHDGKTCTGMSKRPKMFKPTSSNSVDRPIDESKILIVDDEPITIGVARKHLNDAGFKQVVGITDADLAVETIRRENPDLVLLDIRMPKVNGMDILKELQSQSSGPSVPVVVFTSSTQKQTKINALKYGATDFLQKPVDKDELVARIRNTLLGKAHLDYLANYSGRLRNDVHQRISDLAASRQEAVQCLARAAEIRDDETGRHVIRVGRYAAIIADELGFSGERVAWLEHAAQLHDVGKLGIPDAILHKQGQLTPVEWRVMKSHCLAVAKITQDASKPLDGGPVPPLFSGFTSPIMRMALVVAQSHHEKWDGTGYPRGLAGTAIPIEGRITAVADVFDTLSTLRCNDDPLPLDSCFKMMEEGSGVHFDPDILDAFFRRKSEIVRIFHDFGDIPKSNSIQEVDEFR